MYKVIQCIAFISVIALGGCRTPEKQLSSIALQNISGAPDGIKGMDAYTATVIIFLSPECPLSENYTKTLNDIQQQFSEKNMQFYAVFPGHLFGAEKIMHFITTYGVQQKILLDPANDLTRFLQATTTPEVFVLNTDSKVIYSGAIDNWAVDLGQKREVITAFYLIDALQAVLKNETPVVQKTKAVGCFIEVGG